jgi:hypothetical protein
MKMVAKNGCVFIIGELRMKQQSVNIQISGYECLDLNIWMPECEHLDVWI